jgi:hypothetical protein
MPDKVITSIKFHIAPDTLRLDIGVESGEEFTFFTSAAGAAQMAADLAQAAAKAISENPKTQIWRRQGIDTVYAPKVGLKDYGLDSTSGNILLTFEDEHGGIYNFLLDPSETLQFAQRTILNLSNLPPDEGQKH